MFGGITRFAAQFRYSYLGWESLSVESEYAATEQMSVQCLYTSNLSIHPGRGPGILRRLPAGSGRRAAGKPDPHSTLLTWESPIRYNWSNFHGGDLRQPLRKSDPLGGPV